MRKLILKVYTNQNDIHIQYNSYMNTNDNFHRNRKKTTKINMEQLKTPNYHNNPEQKHQCYQRWLDLRQLPMHKKRISEVRVVLNMLVEFN